MRFKPKFGADRLLPGGDAGESGESKAADSMTSVHRARILSILLLLAAAGLVARLWFLQIAHGDQFAQMAQVNQVRLLRRPAPRGDIVDCRGHILAATRPQYAIYAEPAVAKSPLTLRRLSGVLGMSPTAIATTITLLKKNDYDLVRIALNVPIGMVTRVEEQRPYLPGVSTGPEAVRWYPNGSRLANVLGTMGRIDPAEVSANRDNLDYSSSDFVGRTGIEKQYEADLRGTPGGEKIEIDAQGRPLRQVGVQPAAPGRTLQLAIDDRVESAAENVFAEHGWTGGAAAVDPRTGAVLALASSPSFDPNQFASGISIANWSRLNGDPRKPMLDRAVDALYPPGSTFKEVTAAAGLQCGAVTTDSTADCTGVFELGNAKFHCWSVHGVVDFYRAIAQSCDVFFYQVGLKMGPDTLSRYAREYPLAQRTGIDLPQESIGTIPSPAWKQKHFSHYAERYRQWYGGDTLNTAIGQGYVLVTPLQMSLVTATTANGGYVPQPFLVRRVLDGDTHQLVRETQTAILRRVDISPQNLSEVCRGMRECVTNGTGAVVDFPDLSVGAKTGSAQVNGSAKTHGWFVAFAPFDHPTIACAAVVEHGGHGGDSAGLVVRAMLQAYFGLKTTPVRTAKSD